MKTVARLLPHLTIILSGILLVFFVLDQFNPAMGYLDNPAERGLLIVLAVTSIANAILLVACERQER